MRASRLIAVLFLLSILLFGGVVYYWWSWSERFLSPVTVGMSKSQVQKLLGDPRRINEDASAATWDYSRSWSRDARVYFDARGFVQAVETD